MIEIFINGKQADLLPNETFAANYGINPIQEFDKRVGEHSYSYKLPPTANNRKLIEGVCYVGSASNFDKRAVPAQVYDGGMLVMDGILKLVSVDRYITIAIYSGSINFVDAMGDKSLRDVNLSQYDALLNNAYINSNRNNTEGFVYPNCNYGSGFEWYPAIYYPTILKAIIEDAGFEAVGSLFEDALFKKSAVLYTQKQFLKRYGDTLVKVYFKPKASITLGLENEAFAQIDYYQDYKPNSIGSPTTGTDWDTDTGSGTFICGGFTIANDYAGRPFYSEGELVLNITSSTPANGTVRLYAASGPPVNVALSSFAVTGPGTYTIPLTGLSGTFITGTRYIVQVFFDAAIGPIECISGWLRIGNNVDEVQNQTQNQFTDIAYTLPDIKQKDFVKFIYNSFAAQINTDMINRKVYFNLFDDTLNKQKAVDLSSKIDLSEPVEISYKLGDYARSNYLDYKVDEADPLSVNGRGTIAIDSAHLGLEKILYTAPFSLAGRAITSGVETASYPLTTASKLVPKVGVIEINNQNLINIAGQTVLATNAHIYSSDLWFSNLVLLYYKVMTAIIQQQRLYVIRARISSFMISQINQNDIKGNLAYTKPVYINIMTKNTEVNGYFYLNAIKEHKPGRNSSVKVELLPIE